MAELKLSRENTQIIPKALGALTLKNNHGQDDKFLTDALFKVSMGQELSPADEQLLTKAFNLSKIDDLKQFLSITEDNFDDQGTVEDENLDENPFQNLAGKPAAKRSKFTDEILQLEKRLGQLLGFKYTGSGIQKKIDQIKSMLLKHNGDTFEKELNTELNHRLRDQSSMNPIKRDNQFKAIDNDVLGVVIMGTEAEAPPTVKALNANQLTSEEFKVTNIPKGIDAKKWLDYLTKAQANGLPAAEQRIARSLLRKLRDLKEEPSSEAFMGLIKYLSVPKDEMTAQGYQNKFNEMVRELKKQAEAGTANLSEYSSDKELMASLEAASFDDIKKVIFNANDSMKLGKALKLLEDNIDKPLDKKAITDALLALNSAPKFKAAYDAKTSDLERVTLLKQTLKTIAAEKKNDPTLALDPALVVDPSKDDPAKVYADLTRNLEYLNAEINDPARSESSRKNLQEEFNRFFSSGELGPILQNEFGKENSKFAEALNIFRYDRRSIGMVKSLFNRSSKTNPHVFNILDLMRDPEHSSFDDVVEDIELAVVIAGRTNNAVLLPSELIDTASGIKTAYAFSDKAFEPIYDVDPETKEKKFKSSPLLAKLGIEDLFLKSAKIKLIEENGVPKMQMVDGKPDISANLRTLLETTMAARTVDEKTNDKTFFDLMTESNILTKNGEDTYQFNGEQGLKTFLAVINSGARLRHDEFGDYDGYNPETKVDYEKLQKQREELIAFSEKNSLGIFQAMPVLQPYYKTEYKESLAALATNLPHLKRHYNHNLNPYENTPDAKGMIVPRADRIESPFGIDPSKLRKRTFNMDRKTSALVSEFDQLYANRGSSSPKVRALDSAFREDRDLRDSLLRLIQSIISDNYNDNYQQSRIDFAWS